MMRRIFNDENEPFWRSAKPMELGVISPADFGPYIEARFRAIDPLVLGRVLAMTHGHPYATQELGYFLWEEAGGRKAGLPELDRAITSLLRSEHAHFTLIWDHAAATQRVLLQALAAEPGRPYAGEYRRRHNLPAPSSVQRAVEALAGDELVGRDEDGNFRIVEPFLAEWINRNEQ
jgi:hypothetical protein